MNPATAPGPGDSATWPACAGHPNDPRTDDTEDVLSEDDARERAEQEVTCSSASIRYHLWNMCDDMTQSVPLSVLMDRDFEADTATADTLLVVMLHGCEEASRSARYELAQRLEARMQPEINDRAAELLAEHNGE